MSVSYKPVVKHGLLGLLGRFLCGVTGLLLLAVPYKYWLIATATGAFSLQGFSLPMFGLFAVHMVLAAIFLWPSMTEKYLRSGYTLRRKFTARLLAIATLLLLGMDALLFIYKQNIELPALLSGLTSKQWIWIITLWFGPYAGLLIERWSRKFGPVVKVNRPMKRTIGNDEEKTVFERV